MSWVANARMYAVTADAMAAWTEIFEWVAQQSGVNLATIAHPTSLPMAELWTRADLGAGFMCGRPWLRAQPRPVPLVAPVPLPARYGGTARYMTDLVVLERGPFETLEATFGHRIGYTIEESQSGFNAPRHHLLSHRSAERPALYAESIGPLHTPRGVVNALLSGAIDIGPLDSYAFDLMRLDPADPAHRLRSVATTAPAPIPFIVAAPTCPETVTVPLREAFLAAGQSPALAAARHRLLLQEFRPVDISAYDLLSHWDREASAQGYAQPA